MNVAIGTKSDSNMRATKAPARASAPVGSGVSNNAVRVRPILAFLPWVGTSLLDRIGPREAPRGSKLLRSWAGASGRGEPGSSAAQAGRLFGSALRDDSIKREWTFTLRANGGAAWATLRRGD